MNFIRNQNSILQKRDKQIRFPFHARIREKFGSVWPHFHPSSKCEYLFYNHTCYLCIYCLSLPPTPSLFIIVCICTSKNMPTGEASTQSCIPSMMSPDKSNMFSCNNNMWMILQLADSAFPTGGFVHSGKFVCLFLPNITSFFVVTPRSLLF